MTEAMGSDASVDSPPVGDDDIAAYAVDGRELQRLIAVMQRLRHECPWDAEQTHRSLAQYLIEETGEVIEVIEENDSSTTPDHDHLREELGDLLLQVIFHSTIAAESDPDFTVGAVANSVADKLISRHPYVYGDTQVPDDLLESWESRKAREKGRTSVLQGIPEQLSALARANKIISRARSRSVPVELADEQIDERTVGDQLLQLVARAQAHGIDPDQAARDAVRRLEAAVIDAEGAS